jgi:hypothetical protein
MVREVKDTECSAKEGSDEGSWMRNWGEQASVSGLIQQKKCRERSSPPGAARIGGYGYRLDKTRFASSA